MKRLLMRIPTIHLALFVLLLSLIYCSTVTLFEVHNVLVGDFYSVVMMCIHWAIVSFCTFGLFAFISSCKWLFAFTFPPLLLISGIMCYFNLSIGVRLTPGCIDVAMANGADMWWTMVSTGLIITIILCVGIAAAIVVFRWEKVKTTRRFSILTALVGVLIMLTPIYIVSQLYSPITNRLPYSIFYSVREYLDNRKEVMNVRTAFDGIKLDVPDSLPDVIFILGESMRADHVPMNGYGRNTMPRLSADTAVISFANIYSEYTYTDRSVPHIITRADSSRPELAYKEPSFIKLFSMAGYSTFWLANQGLTKSYAYFAHEADSLIFWHADRSLYSYEPWLDSDLIAPFREWYYEGNMPKMAVIHSIGSHWWYPSHYTADQAIFKPEVLHKDVRRLSRETMINSYDNTIVATDVFLSGIIEAIRQRNAILFFISDHGEALGEDGVFLHVPESSKYLHFPACLVWYSDKYAMQNAGKIRALRANAQRAFSTDAVFHTILELAGLNAGVVDHGQSMLWSD